MISCATSKYEPVFHVLDFKVFQNENKLCLATDEEVYGFDLTEVKRIKSADKGMYLPITKNNKNKDIIAKYKFKKFLWQYKVPLCILEFIHNGEAWEIYFPCYELPVFEQVTGLKAE